MTTAAASGPGRRERKKAATRQALSDAALRLFLERGYDQVTVAEIANAADTAVTTLFSHFPAGKEALILDDAREREASLLEAVRGRAEDASLLDALRAFFAGRGVFAAEGEGEEAGDETLRRTIELVKQTPALRAYARQIWVSCQDALAGEIAAENGRREPDAADRVLARFVLEIPDLAGEAADAVRLLDEAFSRLHAAWPEA